MVVIAFMIWQKKRHTKLKTKGFILAEAVFAVFVTFVVVLILQNLVKSLTLANKVQNYILNLALDRQKKRKRSYLFNDQKQKAKIKS